MSQPAPCRAGDRRRRTARWVCGSRDRRGLSARVAEAGSPRCLRSELAAGLARTWRAPDARDGASGEGEGGGDWFFEACGGFKFREAGCALLVIPGRREASNPLASFRGASKMRARNPSSRGNSGRMDSGSGPPRKIARYFVASDHPGMTRMGRYAFLTNSDFRFIAPMPSILQAMLCPSLASCRRMFLTLVPPLTTDDEPLTFRSLITMTLSPSASVLPLASRTPGSSEVSAGPPAAALHSWAHSGHTQRPRSS